MNSRSWSGFRYIVRDSLTKIQLAIVWNVMPVVRTEFSPTIEVRSFDCEVDNVCKDI